MHTLDGIWKLSLNCIYKLHNLHLVYSQQYQFIVYMLCFCQCGSSSNHQAGIFLVLFFFFQNCNKTDVCNRHAPASQLLKNISQLAKSSDEPLCASLFGSFILLNLAHNLWR